MKKRIGDDKSKNWVRRTQFFVHVLGMILLMGLAAPAFAESAPVYDADQMPQQFDDMDQPQQDLPPPPPPGPVQVQEASPENTFVPMQHQQAMEQQEPPPNQSNQTVTTTVNPSLSVNDRLRRVEQQIDNMQNSDSSPRIDALQDQVRLLRGQVEQLTHQLEQFQSQQQNLYSELEKRMAAQQSVASNASAGKPVTFAPNDDGSLAATAKSSRKVVALPKTSVKPVATIAAENVPIKPASDAGQPNVAEEQQIYQTAYNLIKSKKYSDAIAVLQNMLQKYPSGQFASNAHYWLGELYGLLGKNDQALVEFSTVVRSYPDSPRLSDAQLKVGLIYAAQFKWADAKNAFKKVINRYPGTTSARLASEQLKQIKQAGH